MTDRELLELAAKAAGIDWTAHGDFISGAPYLRAANVQLGMWAPLTDDGDALRLAVKLDISILFDVVSPAMSIKADTPHSSKAPPQEPMPGTDSEKAAATRRAIVRAAAALSSLQGKGEPS